MGWSLGKQSFLGQDNYQLPISMHLHVFKNNLYQYCGYSLLDPPLLLESQIHAP